METLEFSTVLAQTSDHNILKIAAKRGLQYPSPHLALFKSIYAKLEDANGNGVRLATKAVEEALPTLIGKQVNFNHQRQNAICGYILDAWLNKNDEIEICFAFFKDVYPEEYQEAIDLMEEGKLTVSFELNSEKSTQEQFKDGTRRLNDINFAGVGLLLNEKPAYAGAKVFETAKRVVSYIFNPNGDLMFANKNECQELMKALSNVLDNNLNEGETNMSMEKEIRVAESINDEVQNPMAKKLSYHEKKSLPDSSFAVVIKKEGRTIRKFPIHDAAHVRNALARLGQTPTQDALKRLGVSVESVRRKVLARAKALGLNDLVKKHEKASEVDKGWQDSVTCKYCGARFDWNAYTNSEKTAAECPGCKDMVDLNGVTVKAKEGEKMATELKIESQEQMEQKIDAPVALDKPVEQVAPAPAGTEAANAAPQTPLPDQKNLEPQKEMEVKVEEKTGLEAPEEPEEKEPAGLEAPVAGSSSPMLEQKIEEKQTLEAPKKLEAPAPIVPESDRKTSLERQAEAEKMAPKEELPAPEKKMMPLNITYAELESVIKDAISAYMVKREVNRVETEALDPETNEKVMTVKHNEHHVHTDNEGNKSIKHVESQHKETYSQAELDAVREEYEAALPPEVTKKIKELMKEGKPMKDAMKEAWAEYKKDMKKASEEIAKVKAELEAAFTANWSDEDYLDPVKVKIARLEQENAQLKAKQVVAAKKEEKPVETAALTPAVDLETGHDDSIQTASDKVDVAAAINSRVKVMRFGKEKKSKS